ncbi:MAG: terminase family protein [Clostridia bacterium]|nr:terminase family protein [Clostridia bacterium]
MDKIKIIKLLKIQKEINVRNLLNLSRYNTGKIIHQKQLMFHQSQKRNRWVFGGNRTGKTECGAVETIWLSLGIHPFRKNKPQTECWVVSLSTRVQKEVAQAKILKYLPKNTIKNITMISGKREAPEFGVIESISVINSFGNISKIWFKSCEEGREKFQGASLDFVWFDEEPPEDIYNECKMRIMDRSGEIFGTMTPLKGLSFIYNEIYLNKNNDPEVYFQFMSWEDNPYLNKAEIKRLSASLSADELATRKDGKFYLKDCGLVYSEFEIETHVIEPFEIPADWQDIISIDPGLSNPLSCHWYAKDYDNNVYVIAEHYESNQTIEYHSNRIKEISASLSWKKARNGMIECLIDSAANQKTLSSPKSVAELFYENGILCNTNVNKNLLAGISKVKTFLKSIDGKTKLFIFSSCKNLIREFKTYRWGGGDNPIKIDDHSLDELRYYIMNLPAQNLEKRYLTEIQRDKEKLVRSLKRNEKQKIY